MVHIPPDREWALNATNSVLCGRNRPYTGPRYETRHYCTNCQQTIENVALHRAYQHVVARRLVKVEGTFKTYTNGPKKRYAQM